MSSIIDDQLYYALCRIVGLEEMFEDAQDQIRCLVEGDSVEWDLA